MSSVICMEGIKTVLRPVNPETDFELLWPAVNDVSISQFILARPPITAASEREYLENLGKDGKDIVFAICEKSSQNFLGLMGLYNINWQTRIATTGALIANKEFWGKGYGYDAKMQVLHYAFHFLNLHRIDSSVVAFNKRSAGCLLKCGYKEEGVRREYHFRHGKYFDQILFGILRRDFDPIWKRYSKDLKEVNEAWVEA